ncbi:hypothetical protein JCM10908_006457 [Rhodotorula pacifica]|uniref:carbon-nitrogen hydrolase family protein n=1 Tax=Rhodotorula pacifica TaxID=1495444 RepID=UPI00317E6E5A
MPRVALVQFASLPPSAPLPLPAADASSSSQADTKDADDRTHGPSKFNLQRAHDFVRQAARQGAELVVFPEYFLSGVVSGPEHWHLAQYPHSHAHLHRPSDSETATAEHWLSTFRSLAKELKVDIVVGTIVERAVDEEGKALERQIEIENDETGEKRLETRPVLENVSTYIDWNGEIVGRYKKRNLWWPEKDYLCAGDEEHQVFNTRFGKVGLLVCWDLAWPRAFEPLLLRGAEMIIAPTYWTGTDGGPEGLKHNPNSETDFLEVLVKTRAWDNECAILFCNIGAPASWSPGDPMGNEEGRIGCSQVCVPFKGKIGGAKGPQEELVLVDLDLSILDDARKVYGMRRDLITKLRQEGKLPDYVKDA